MSQSSPDVVEDRSFIAICIRQTAGKVASAVHDAFNAELIACLVEDKMLVEGTGDLKTPDASKFW